MTRKLTRDEKRADLIGIYGAAGALPTAMRECWTDESSDEELLMFADRMEEAARLLRRAARLPQESPCA